MARKLENSLISEDALASLYWKSSFIPNLTRDFVIVIVIYSCELSGVLLLFTYTDTIDFIIRCRFHVQIPFTF